MKKQNFNLVRYDADDGLVFDWAEPHFIDIFDDNGNIIDQEIEHLFAKTLFIGDNDSIDNYVEVKAS